MFVSTMRFTALPPPPPTPTTLMMQGEVGFEFGNDTGALLTQRTTVWHESDTGREPRRASDTGRSGGSAGGVLTSEESGAVERRQQREDPPRLVMVGWWVVRRRLIKVFVSGIFTHITWLVRQRWGPAWCAAPRSDASPDCNANRQR